jgi:spoIIIJ-associated protein
MEWVETTGKTVAEALETALDRLGVAEDEAEYEVLDEPKSGLFGRMRGEARVRARVRPAAVRPKQDRRQRARSKGRDGGDGGGRGRTATVTDGPTEEHEAGAESTPREDGNRDGGTASGDGADRGSRSRGGQRRKQSQRKDNGMEAHDERQADDEVAPEAVGEAASEFMTGLVAAFGATGSATVQVDGSEIDVRVDGSDLGLLIGPGGRTLAAVQDLARVASQRRLGDHDTRLRIDVAGYRERRRAALEKFASAVADEVLDSGRAKALEPMSSADRKVVHDVIQGIDGVSSHSDGDEPRRRVVITPA